MSKIINFYGFDNNSYQNEKLNYINKIYKENFLKAKEDIIGYSKQDSLNFLVNNFNNLNKTLSLIEPSKIDFFLDLIIYLVNKNDQPDLKVWEILYTYNLYRIYGEKLKEISNNNIDILSSLMMSFDEDYDIKSLDNICDFIFDDEIRKKLDTLNVPNNIIVHLLESAVGIYLEEGKVNNISLKYYINEEIKNYEYSRLKVIEKINFNIPEDIYNYLKESVYVMANFMIDTMLKENINRGNELLNDLDLLIFKMKNMKEENRKICMNIIEKLLNSDNYSLIDKIELSFDFIDQFYEKDNCNIRKI